MALQSPALRVPSPEQREQPTACTANALIVLVVAPSLQAGAAAGAVELTRILAAGGHKPSGGRLLQDVTAAGARFIAMNVASQNSVAMLRNAMAMVRLVRAHRCDVIHAHGRAPGWSAYFAAQRTGEAFLTTWYKGFREQNGLKRLYNSVVARGDHVIAPSDRRTHQRALRYAVGADHGDLRERRS